MSKTARRMQIRSGFIGCIDTANKYARMSLIGEARRSAGEMARRTSKGEKRPRGGWKGLEREGDSLVVQHGSVRTARFLDVCRVVLRSPVCAALASERDPALLRRVSVCVCVCATKAEKLQGPKSPVRGPPRGPYYARRGPENQRTRRFGRSGSTLKRGIYCSNSFCSIFPAELPPSVPPCSSSFLKRSARGVGVKGTMLGAKMRRNCGTNVAFARGVVSIESSLNMERLGIKQN